MPESFVNCLADNKLALMNKSLSFYLLPVLFALVLFSCGHGKATNTISTDSLSIARGKIIFDQSCSGCHGFHQDGIGPDLSGIIEKDSADWIKEFIHSPQAMVGLEMFTQNKYQNLIIR